MCERTPWITWATGIALFVGGCLAIVLMQKAEKDQQINRVDSKPFRKWRRGCFIAVAFFAWISMIPDAAEISRLLLFTSTAILLVVDILALEHRPPLNGKRLFAGRLSFLTAAPSRLRSMLTVFRRH